MQYAQFADQTSLKRKALDVLSEMVRWTHMINATGAPLLSVEAHDEKRSLLVVGAHGQPYTGTRLDVGEGIDFHELSDVFQVPLANLIVYVPACWGAYPNVIQAVSNSLGNTTMIGAMVDVRHRDAVNIESKIIDILITNDTPIRALVRMICVENRRLRRIYNGRDAFRIVWGGRWYPRQGEGGLSAPVENIGEVEVVTISTNKANIEFATLQTRHGDLITHAEYLASILECSTSQLVGKKVKLYGRLGPSGPARRVYIEENPQSSR